VKRPRRSSAHGLDAVARAQSPIHFPTTSRSRWRCTPTARAPPRSRSCSPSTAAPHNRLPWLFRALQLPTSSHHRERRLAQAVLAAAAKSHRHAHISCCSDPLAPWLQRPLSSNVARGVWAARDEHQSIAIVICDQVHRPSAALQQPLRPVGIKAANPNRAGPSCRLLSPNSAAGRSLQCRQTGFSSSPGAGHHSTRPVSGSCPPRLLTEPRRGWRPLRTRPVATATTDFAAGSGKGQWRLGRHLRLGGRTRAPAGLALRIALPSVDGPLQGSRFAARGLLEQQRPAPRDRRGA